MRRFSTLWTDSTLVSEKEGFFCLVFFCFISKISALLPFASAGHIDVVDGRFLHHVVRNKVNLEELCKAVLSKAVTNDVAAVVGEIKR